ncbi:hypothetical protein [uncultured Caulobacter sp.]|uniref:hypothetical protein n=1 Tax=uncultured Caulobacter sp. TaxID=158749 RepID=UPI00260B6DFF|nr:hypothetical protein [uncultured Caulobacter sp.]
MVLRMTGTSVLAAMMRAERPRRAPLAEDFTWLLHGPTGVEVVEDDAPPPRLLAAE